MKKKQPVTTDLILDNLPLAPDGYHYEVRKESQMWWSIWLVHPEGKYNYTDEPVKTIYAWVKRTGAVHRPLNHLKPHQREVVCTLVDLRQQPKYTVIVPKVTSLLHLL